MNKKIIIISIVIALLIFLGYKFFLAGLLGGPKVLIEEETYCIKDSDCVITSYTYQCCGSPCGGAVINLDAFKKRSRWTGSYCWGWHHNKCPSVNCRYVNEIAICENNVCVRKIIE